MTIDRSHVARCLAKAIAYKHAGKDSDADAWARSLVVALNCAGILAHGEDSASTKGGG